MSLNLRFHILKRYWGGRGYQFKYGSLKAQRLLSRQTRRPAEYC